jgi:hypothetical protein
MANFKLICVTDVTKEISEEVKEIARREHHDAMPLNFLLIRKDNDIDIYVNIGEIENMVDEKPKKYIVIRECCGCKDVINR